MSAVEKMLGEAVVDSKGNKVAVSSFSGSGKFIGLYFSAHWCPPCRGFTPVLANFYTAVKADSSKADKLEIVFISSDRDVAAWTEYFGEMPWKALPYEKRDEKQALSEKFGVRGIPTFIVLNAETGDIVHQDGRSMVMEDTEGARFPNW